MSLRSRLILIASILAAILFLKFITPEIYTGYDGQFYAAMTRELISNNPKTTTAPYNYRLLPAWLLHFVPLKTETAFSIYNALIASLSAYLLFFLFLHSGYTRFESALGTFFFIFAWINIRLHFFYPILVDSTYYFILILAFWSLRRGHDLPYLLSLTLGVLTRENFFSLIPVYYFYRKKGGGLWEGKAFQKTVAVATGPVLVFFLLRIVIPNTNPDFGYLKNLFYYGHLALVHWRRIIHAYFNVFGVAMLIIFLHLPTVLRFLRHNQHLAAYLIATIIFSIISGGDTDRYAFYAFPAVLILALHAMREHRDVYRNRLLLGFLAVSQLYLMRVFRPMSTANWRRIWWSNISFCPEEVFRSSSLTYLAVFLVFVLLYLGLSLRARPTQKYLTANLANLRE